MELGVFVSSPSDCASERDVVVRVVEKLNASYIPRSTGLTLRVIRWEDLPPGQTTDHNYQARIDEQLRKIELDRTHIYVGCMRDRVGTPTHGYASGTIYEFETALASRRRTGLPAEVFFYFLREDTAAPAPVAAFSAQLRDRGFLYSVTAKDGEFELRLTQHLSNVMLGWWQWRNRIRRGVRGARVPALVMLGAATVAYLGTDIATAFSVRSALTESRHEDALRLWSNRHAYFPVASTWLSGEMLVALRAIATTRLLDSLISLGGDPFSWETSELRDFEIETLREHLRSNVPKREAAPMRHLAYIAFTRDWTAAEQASTAELSGDDPAQLLAASAFALHGPAERVAIWLKRAARPDLAPPVVGHLLDIVFTRNDATLVASALELLGSGRLGKTAQAFDLPITCTAQPCRNAANALLTQWSRDGSAPSEQLLSVTLDLASLDEIAIPSDELSDALIRFAREPQFSAVTRPILRALATLDTEHGRAFVLDLFSQHLNENISFGWAEKSGLIEAAAALGTPDDRSVLKLAQLAASQAAESARPGESPSDGMTQTSYVAYLAAHPPRSMTRQLPYLRTLIARRVESRLSIWGPDFDQAMKRLLSVLSDADALSLFEYTGSVVVDDFGGRLSERRAYLLQLLQDLERDLSIELTTAIIRMMPILPDRTEHYLAAIARHGGNAARDYFRRRLAEGDSEILKFIALNGDEETMRRAIPHPAPTATAALEEFVQALSQMEGEARQRVLVELCRLWAQESPETLWPEATKVKYEDGRLVEAAVTALRRAANLDRATRAIRYLQAVRPDLVWHTLSEPSARESVIRMLTTADPFDFVKLTQELPQAPKEVDVTEWMRAAVDIRKPTVFEQKQIDLAPPTANGLMRISEDTWMGNPLLFALATGTAPDAAKMLLDSATGSGTVESLGKLPQAQVNFDAYLIWHAAARASASHPQDTAALFEKLQAGSPVQLRAWAGFALGATR